MPTFRNFNQDDPWDKEAFKEEWEREHPKQEQPPEPGQPQFAEFYGQAGTVLEWDQPSYEDWRVKELDDITRSTWDPRYKLDDPQRTPPYDARYEAYRQGEAEAQQQAADAESRRQYDAGIYPEAPAPPVEPDPEYAAVMIAWLPDFNHGTLAPERLERFQEEVRELYDLPEKLAEGAWPDRYAHRDDGNLTDTTTGEIVARPGYDWPEAPEPEERPLYVFAGPPIVSEDGLSGVIPLTYVEEAPKESRQEYDIFGMSVKDDGPTESEDDDKDDDGDSWRLF